MATYVVVGGVAGGASAAARLRRRDESAEIIMIERGRYVSFANCGLPYHIGHEIPERDALLVSTPEKLCDEFNIDVRTEQEVVRIDREARQVEVRDLQSGELYRQSYDRLILAPGAAPLVPPIPGVTLDDVYTLRTMSDMDRIKARIDAGGVNRAVVVGGGFIGLEMAEALHSRDIQVTIVEMLYQVMSTMDFEMAAILHRHLREKGVCLGLGDGLREIEPDGNEGMRVVLSSGRTVPADLVVLALGVRPESALARDAGLILGPRGHVVVNEHMQTSDPNIYAVGDVVQITNPVTGTPGAIPLAGPANRQARVAADHITGLDHTYPGTIGSAIVKVFDMTAASTGANSATLEREGIAYLSSITHSFSHASYYPGAGLQTIKLFYGADDGRLLGAQVVGYDAVDRTINVLATALRAGMTVYDLEHLELAYAPPYGAAKDPVNIAGYVAGNHLRGDTDLIDWKEVRDLGPERVGLLDVRTDPEWQLGHIPGAVHIPNVELRDRLDELDKDKEWVVYCAVGRRAYVMERMLRQRGYRVRNLTGGWTTYDVATERQDNLDDAVIKDFSPEQREPADEGDGNGNGHAHDVAVLTPAMRVDARGQQCPGPILSVYRAMQGVDAGAVLEAHATDPGFRRDVAAWAERTGNTLLSLRDEDGDIVALLRKGRSEAHPVSADRPVAPISDAKTIIVFSADLDRALAAFIIANGAAAMGQKVTLFFTFWGLNILRRHDAVRVRKSLMERMFGWMLPRGPEALKLSRLNMGGAGTAMIKAVMRSKNIDPLPALIRSAQENGVRLIACQMSMDMMGIKPEELVDGVEIGGVATYISETDKANASLFI
ncbi:MAG: FAD-dependent oxidoreductase [Anaerolineae bacterium]|jgi:NADPH-dependent 2,4-dienoyl-CoA reductase/sulfur reductase-like enzyme/peroxiredoxin family protein/rhodanese-related sulfurtransferase/TusA-related sulfurtransferase